MKGLTLYQPWASAIAVRAKLIETRSWYTRYRGPLAIHAAKRWTKDDRDFLMLSRQFYGALSPLCIAPFGCNFVRLPAAAIVCVCDLVDCKPVAQLNAAELDRRVYPGNPRLPLRDVGGKPVGPEYFSWTERDMGDYRPGRYGWILANVRCLSAPLPWTGQRGLFEIPDDEFMAAATAAGVTP